MSMFIEEISTAVALSGVAGAAAALLLEYFRRNRQGHYDQDRHRAELEMLRASIENQMYKLNDRLVSTEERWLNLNHLVVSRQNTQADEPPSELTLNGFLKSYGISQQDLQIDPRLIFVLTPFHQRFLESFHIIAAACSELDFRCVRGDEQEIQGDLLPHIIRLIVKARAIVAVIDGRNPNVFYELGIAHALNKTTILVSKSAKYLPLDVRSRKIVMYDDMGELYAGIQKELSRSLIAK